jgi:hypothetical protein
MPKIGPARTLKELQATLPSTTKPEKGVQAVAALPAVKTDAKTVDPKAYEKNRELAKRIGAAVQALKEKDKGVPRFVLGWRMYPNRDDPYWEGKVHSCGCGCACAGP